MKKFKCIVAVAAACCVTVMSSMEPVCGAPVQAVANAVADDGLLLQMPFQEVRLQDEFWLPRLKTQKEVLVPFALDKARVGVENLKRTANYIKGIPDEKPIEPRYVSSDLFKVMEGAAYLLVLQKDPALEHRMDSIIDIIAEAQLPDGYMYEAHITHTPMWDAGEGPYSSVLNSHELYNMGHMYEGAIAYYRATGKDKWLKVAEKSARHINKVFFEGDPAYNGGKPVMEAPGHEEIELALVKLYQTTGDRLYLDMAKRFIDIRGMKFRADTFGIKSATYPQMHKPVREQRKAVGHAVRAGYLYSGMADVMAQTGDKSLKPALDSIWADIINTRMHIHGGLGGVRNIEGFGDEYDLPNAEAYCETCAGVANVLFNYRMFLAEHDAKYIDVAEVALYNNVLAGVNLEGNLFFYVNPMASDGKWAFNHVAAGRAPWFDTACCPSNLARLVPQVSGMIYSHTGSDIYCALYAGNTTTVPLDGGDVELTQTTAYPYGETVAIDVAPARGKQKFAMHLRIPTWTADRFVPGNLYSYTGGNAGGYTVKVNGKPAKFRVEKGFAVIDRNWKKGDRVEITMPMPVRYNVADSRVKADLGRVCVTRGPLLYCAEAADNSASPLSYFVAPGAEAKVGKYSDGILRNIGKITIPASSSENASAKELTLLPYYAWNNRGDDAMNVWFNIK